MTAYPGETAFRKALDVLDWEVREGKVDPDLFQVFKEGRVWELTLRS